MKPTNNSSHIRGIKPVSLDRPFTPEALLPDVRRSSCGKIKLNPIEKKTIMRDFDHVYEKRSKSQNKSPLAMADRQPSLDSLCNSLSSSGEPAIPDRRVNSGPSVRLSSELAATSCDSGTCERRDEYSSWSEEHMGKGLARCLEKLAGAGDDAVEAQMALDDLERLLRRAALLPPAGQSPPQHAAAVAAALCALLQRVSDDRCLLTAIHLLVQMPTDQRVTLVVAKVLYQLTKTVRSDSFFTRPNFVADCLRWFSRAIDSLDESGVWTAGGEEAAQRLAFVLRALRGMATVNPQHCRLVLTGNQSQCVGDCGRLLLAVARRARDLPRRPTPPPPAEPLHEPADSTDPADHDQPEQWLQILVQATGLVRTLVESAFGRVQFLTAGMPTTLCCVGSCFVLSQETVLNVCRSFSLLCSSDEVGQFVNSFASFAVLFNFLADCLTTYADQTDIAVRALFVIANCAAVSSEFRTAFDNENAMEILLSLTKQYYEIVKSDTTSRGEQKKELNSLQRCWALEKEAFGKMTRCKSLPRSPSAARLRERVDVLLKSVSALANLTLNCHIALTVAAKADTLQLLVDCTSEWLVRRCADASAAAMSVLHNVTYWATSPTDVAACGASAIVDSGDWQAAADAVGEAQLDIANALLVWLAQFHYPTLRLEATRVFCNLSRLALTRKLLVKQSGLTLLTDNLATNEERRPSASSSFEAELAYCSVGCLLNMSADAVAQQLMLRLDLLSRLNLVTAAALTDNDPELLEVCYKLAWNIIVMQSEAQLSQDVYLKPVHELIKHLKAVQSSAFGKQYSRLDLELVDKLLGALRTLTKTV